MTLLFVPTALASCVWVRPRASWASIKRRAKLRSVGMIALACGLSGGQGGVDGFSHRIRHRHTNVGCVSLSHFFVVCGASGDKLSACCRERCLCWRGGVQTHV